ncbi:hypothetical protein T439DRAFT_323141 [Meredithblackwellia eburnea MCA 4105]
MSLVNMKSLRDSQRTRSLALSRARHSPSLVHHAPISSTTLNRTTKSPLPSSTATGAARKVPILNHADLIDEARDILRDEDRRLDHDDVVVDHHQDETQAAAAATSTRGEITLADMATEGKRRGKFTDYDMIPKSKPIIILPEDVEFEAPPRIPTVRVAGGSVDSSPEVSPLGDDDEAEGEGDDDGWEILDLKDGVVGERKSVVGAARAGLGGKFTAGARRSWASVVVARV